MADLRAHYDAVRDRCDPVDFPVGEMPAPAARRRFVAADGADVLRAAGDDRTAVCTGVGMTGPPHLGTVGQIRTALALQAAGFDVQFVLADLEPYHGGGDRETIEALAERYRSFVLDLGFDPDRGRLRTQAEARDVMHTGHLLARYYRPDTWNVDVEPTAWERAVQEAYEEAAASFAADADDGPTSPAADHHSAVLHGADFLHPLAAGDYDRVVLAFGVDERHLTPLTRRFLAETPVEGALAGLYTRMIPGLAGHPKMGKRLPGSSITLAMDAGTIRDRLANPGDGGARPANSPVFQSMCLAGERDPAELDRLERACTAGGEAWERARREFAADVVDLAERWQATGG